MRRTKGWFFRTHPMFEGAPADRLDWLEQVAEVVELKKKSALWLVGQPAERVYWVRSGVVKISKVTEQGRELTLQFHTKGDLVGEVAAFTSGPYESVAEAYEDLVLYALTVSDFVRLMRAWPELVFRVSGLMGERRRRLENRVGGLLFRTAHQRLASLFLELAEDFGVRDSRGVIVNLKLTHKEMASLIGATRETVSFAILDLRRDGLILTEQKRVVIADEPGLQALASP